MNHVIVSLRNIIFRPSKLNLYILADENFNPKDLHSLLLFPSQHQLYYELIVGKENSYVYEVEKGIHDHSKIRTNLHHLF